MNKSLRLVAALLAAVFAFGLTPLRAQGVPAPGLQVRADLQLPGGAFVSGFDRIPGGDLLYLDAGILRRRSGSTTRTVHALPQGSFGGFVQATSQGVYFAETSKGTIYRFDPTLNAATLLTSVKDPYDLAEAPGGVLYLSAGYGTIVTAYRTRIFRLDHRKGGLTLVADLAGPSGPIAFDAGGALYYATQSSVYPTPPGAIKILRWNAAALAAAVPANPLTELSAQVVKAGLDGAYDLVVDRFGRISVSDPTKGGVCRWDPASARWECLLAPKGSTVTGHTTLRLVAAAGAATLDPWQPAHGEALLAQASDYATFTRIEELTPRRPVLTGLPWPGLKPGTLTLRLSQAPARSPALLLISPRAFAPEQPISWWGPAPLFIGAWLHPQALILPTTTDTAGAFQLQLPYGGGGPLTVYLQCYFPGGPTGFLGTSNPWGLQLL